MAGCKEDMVGCGDKRTRTREEGEVGEEADVEAWFWHWSYKFQLRRLVFSQILGHYVELKKVYCGNLHARAYLMTCTCMSRFACIL